MKNQILKFVIENTNRSTMDDVDTRQVAKKFNITTYQAYNYLKELSKEKLITYLEPVNADNLACAGWIANN